MKAPNFIKIRVDWRGEKESISELKPGDKLILSFGQKRERDLNYEVKGCSYNREKRLIWVSLTRG